MWLGWGTLLAFVIVSRLRYAPPYLYFFDNANFAFAIDHFDPRMHQPQPPGYPMFVALLKVLNLFLHSANRALIVSGLIGSVAGVVLVWQWAARMFGAGAGWAAAALLAVHPVFWVAGVANPVRTFLVVIAAATAVLSWRSMTDLEPKGWFYALSCGLGLLAGFRPECMLLFFPLWIASGLFRGLKARAWTLGSAILLASALVWLVPLVTRMGGIGATYLFFLDYLRLRSQTYAAAFGAGGTASAATIRRVFVFSFGLSVAWIWAVPFALRRLHGSWSPAHTVLAAGAFLPAFLFQALVHMQDVDQALVTIPAVCVIGGAVLASVRPRRVMLAFCIAAVFMTARTFRHPMFHDMDAASGSAIRYMNDWDRSTFVALHNLGSNHDAVLVWDDSPVTWRQVSYYCQTSRLLVLEHDPPFWVGPQQGLAASVKNGAVLVPGASALVIGASYERANALARLPGAERRGPLVAIPWGPGAAVRVGREVLRWSP